MKTFEDLIFPITPEQFFTEYYRKKPLHIAGQPDKAACFLNWQSFNEILSQNRFWTADNLKLWLDRVKVPEKKYCDETPSIHGVIQQANPEKVMNFLSAGATMVANDIDTLSPNLNRIAKILDDTIFGMTLANAYCSFQGIQGFEAHYDDHEVFALQAEGSKRWRVYQARLDNPIEFPEKEESARMRDMAKRNLLFEIEAQPGDVLYLPRGQYHEALASSEASLHITFSAFPLKGMDIFEGLKKQAEQRSIFREDLPLPDGKETPYSLKDYIALLAKNLTEISNSQEFLTEIAHKQRQNVVSRQGYTIPNFPKPDNYSVEVPGLKLVTEGPQTLLTNGSNSLTVPPELIDHVSWIIQKTAFSTADLHKTFEDGPSKLADKTLDWLSNIAIIIPTTSDRLPGN